MSHLLWFLLQGIPKRFVPKAPHDSWRTHMAGAGQVFSLPRPSRRLETCSLLVRLCKSVRTSPEVREKLKATTPSNARHVRVFEDTLLSRDPFKFQALGFLWVLLSNEQRNRAPSPRKVPSEPFLRVGFIAFGFIPLEDLGGPWVSMVQTFLCVCVCVLRLPKEIGFSGPFVGHIPT